MPSASENLEAAKLAKMIGSQLNMIDKYHVDRSNVPANRIDINKFIKQVVNPHQQVVKNDAGYISEAMVQQMIPEIKEPPPVIDQAELLIQNVSPVSIVKDQKKVSVHSISELSKEEKKKIQNQTNQLKHISKISNTLEKISNALEKLVEIVQNNNNENNEKHTFTNS